MAQETNQPQGVAEAQLESLLRVIDGYREEHCRALLHDAGERAAALVRQALQQARTRVHETIQEERSRAQEAINDAQAHLRTVQRGRLQRVTSALLESGWGQLHEALMRRWEDPGQRRQWVDALSAQAQALLPPDGWVIRHPPQWSEEERRGLARALAAQLNRPPHLEPDASIAAGLRIETGGAYLDGTLEGLLADRRAIEAMLLAEL